MTEAEHVAVTHQEFVPRTVSLLGLSRGITHEVMLSGGTLLRGRVIDHRGHFLAGAYISVATGGATGLEPSGVLDGVDLESLTDRSYARVTQSSSTGEFSIGGLLPGRHLLRIEKLGYALDADLNARSIDLPSGTLTIPMCRVYTGALLVENKCPHHGSHADDFGLSIDDPMGMQSVLRSATRLSANAEQRVREIVGPGTDRPYYQNVPSVPGCK